MPPTAEVSEPDVRALSDPHVCCVSWLIPCVHRQGLLPPSIASKAIHGAADRILLLVQAPISQHSEWV